MGKKEFQFKRGDNEIDFSIEYRMPTQKEFLSIAGIVSLVVGAICLFTAFSSEEE